jgi:hypothetical protein
MRPSGQTKLGFFSLRLAKQPVSRIASQLVGRRSNHNRCSTKNDEAHGHSYNDEYLW